MSTSAMLARQTALLRYLTEPESFRKCGEAQLLGPDQAIDHQALAFIGKKAVEKRAGKIRRRLPRTCKALGSKFASVMWRFSQAWPPMALRGIESAEQFLRFLENERDLGVDEIPYLLDLCRIELAIARVLRPEEEVSYFGAVIVVRASTNWTYRVRGACELVKCDHDIRPLFDASGDRSVLPRTVSLLAIGLRGKLRILEVTPDLEEVVSAIRACEPATTAVLLHSQRLEHVSVLQQLGLLEIVG